MFGSALAPARAFQASDSTRASAADTLIQHLGLVRRLHAVVQDLYSRPIVAPAPALAPDHTWPMRPFRPGISATERDAA